MFVVTLEDLVKYGPIVVLVLLAVLVIGIVSLPVIFLAFIAKVVWVKVFGWSETSRDVLRLAFPVLFAGSVMALILIFAD